MQRKHQHTIDFLFPIALFFVFSATALIVVLFAANIYQGIVKDSDVRFSQETSLSYIQGKIRQYDTDDAVSISLEDFQGYDALAIRETYQDISYVTYIYEAEGELKELFSQEGALVSPQSGSTIMEIEDLQIESIEPGLFKFTCTSADGISDSVMVGVHSQN